MADPPPAEDHPAPNVSRAQAETRWAGGTKRASTRGQEITQRVWEIPLTRYGLVPLQERERSPDGVQL